MSATDPLTTPTTLDEGLERYKRAQLGSIGRRALESLVSEIAAIRIAFGEPTNQAATSAYPLAQDLFRQKAEAVANILANVPKR